jgi:hypothetical protein
MSEFGFDGYSPAITFVMMPAYEDLLRIQAIEINDMIRKSQYSFSVFDNKVHFSPLFKTDTKVWFDYMVVEDKMSGHALYQSGSENSFVSDFSNVPYDNIEYKNINSIGRLWVYKFTLALAKETLGNIRSKYENIPIPDATIRLDGETLRREAETEKEGLIKELRETLEQTGHQAQMEKQMKNAEAMQSILQRVPVPIYIF